MVSRLYGLNCPILALVFVLLACKARTSSMAQGWFLGGQPLASTRNEILPAGATLYLPEKFTLEAATDCVVRLTQQSGGETLVQLLTGTAVAERKDPQFAIALLANEHLVRLNGTRLLLQNQMGKTQIYLIDGQAIVSHAEQKWELSAKTENLFEMKAGTQATRKISAREIESVFPEIARARLLLAVR